MKLPAFLSASAITLLLSFPASAQSQNNSPATPSSQPAATATPSPQPQLSHFEQSLVGTWYLSGNADKLEYVASSGSTIFAINDSRDAYQIFPSNAGTFIARHNDIETSAVVTGDYILWKGGAWWSRSPVSVATTTARDLAGHWSLLADSGYQADVVLNEDGTGTHSGYGDFNWQIVGGALYFGSQESAPDKFQLPIKDGVLKGVNRLGNVLTITKLK